MARVRSSPPGSPAATVGRAVIPPVMATAIVVLVTAFLVPAAARTPVAACGVVAMLAVAAVAGQGWRHARTAEGLRRRYGDEAMDLRRRLAEQETLIVRLAESVLPAAMERLRQGDTVDEVMDAIAPRDAPERSFHAAHLEMMRSVLDAVKAEEDLRDSAQRAFVNIACRVQAIVHQQFQDLREMEDRHGRDAQVFGDLLKVDHGTALIGRLADSIAVLGGSRPGRQWQKDVPLYSVLRGAVSRITDYPRVDLHSVVEVAVAGPAVEPLIHALAELLDNATRYSPPHTRVHLTAIEVQSGVAVEIEDGGVGLSEEARVRAERVFSQASTGLDLADLGETPRLGLSVVGRLAQAHGFQVALRPSAYAGVRAVLVIPHELVSPVAAPPAAVPGPAAVNTASIGMRAEPDRAPETERVINGNGLPQRRRHIAVGRAGTVPDPTPAPAATGQLEAPVSPGLWLAAFQNSASEAGSGSSGTAGDDPSTTEGEQA
jgi:signal transduction histidine kinase